MGPEYQPLLHIKLILVTGLLKISGQIWILKSKPALAWRLKQLERTSLPLLSLRPKNKNKQNRKPLNNWLERFRERGIYNKELHKGRKACREWKQEWNVPTRDRHHQIPSISVKEIEFCNRFLNPEFWVAWKWQTPEVYKKNCIHLQIFFPEPTNCSQGMLGSILRKLPVRCCWKRKTVPTLSTEGSYQNL